MKKAIKRCIAALLVCISVNSFAGCSFYFEAPDWAKQALCDHVFDEEEIIKEPTCGDSGQKIKICSDCGKTEHVIIKATGEHVFDGGVTGEGIITYTCMVCGETKTEEHVCSDADDNFICDGCGGNYYPFDNPSLYTEVEVEDGEFIAGNWYRLYRPTTESSTGENDGVVHFNTNIKFENPIYETNVIFIVKHKAIPEGNVDEYFSWTGPLLGSHFTNMISVITDEYIDLYLAPGVYICASNSTTTATINEGSTITVDSLQSAYIKRLVLN